MNRLPAMLTMIDPGELRSDSANHGAPTNGTVGPHHASSINSNAAPSFSAARMPSPVLAFAPTVHSVVIGCALVLDPHLFVVFETTAPQDHPAASPNQLRLGAFRSAHVPDVHAAHHAVLDIQVGQRGVEQHRHTGVAQPDPQRTDQCASHADQVLAGRLRPHGPRTHLQAAQHTAGMTLEHVQPHVILLHHHDVERNLAVRRFEVRTRSGPSLRASNGFGSIERPPPGRREPRGSSRNSRGPSTSSGACASARTTASRAPGRGTRRCARARRCRR